MTLPVAFTPSQLEAFGGDAVRAYLLHSGWDLRSSDERTQSWIAVREGRRLTVVLPLIPEADDYIQLLGEAVRVIAFASRKSVVEVVADLEYGGADVISVRLTPDAPSGQAPLPVAHAAITALRDFVVGAAAGLTAKWAVLRGPRRRADEFARRVRVSTSSGSFIVTLSLPLLEPLPSESSGGQLEDEPDNQLTFGVVEHLPTVPLGRQVATRMRRVATQALILSDQVLSGDEDISVFEDDPRTSGNATELEALATMGGRPSDVYGLRFAESPVVPSNTTAPTVLTIPTASQEQFRRAALLLRERKSKDDVTITGQVVGLSRDGDFGPGQVVVRGRERQALNQHRYRVQLSEDQFAQALAAFSREVSLRGRLSIRGNFLWVEDLLWFSVQQALPEGEWS
jgi:hypothetical protein